MATPSRELKAWLQAALDACGRSQVDLSKHLTNSLGRSIDKTAVNKMLNGVRRIKGDELLEIARFTGSNMPESHSAVRSSDTRIISAGETRTVMLEILGVAETGAYRIAAQEPAPTRTSVVPYDPRFPDAQQYILRQRGDGMVSATPSIADGAYVRCVDAEDSQVNLRDGQIVVVEHRINDGALVERSLRRVRVLDGQLTLSAESPTPYPDLKPGSDVTVTGFVTSVVNVLDLM